MYNLFFQSSNHCEGKVLSLEYHRHGRVFSTVAKYFNGTMSQIQDYFPNESRGFNGKKIKVGSMPVSFNGKEII